jgi:AcrR family transcriptional regulator
MRPKNQTARREQLRQAAREVLLERGAVGLRLKDVAGRAGLASSSILYYYPDIAELLLDVARGAMERYAEERSAAVREVEGPAARLRLAIRLGVPTGPEDEDSRLLYEIDALTGASPAFRVLSAAFFDRQVALYESLIEAGAATGEL